MAAASRATMSSGWRSAQPRLRPYAARTVSKISSLRRWRTLFSCCFRRRAHIIGVSVRDTTSDSRIAADSVSANSRNRRPTMSPMNRIGMKTDRKSTRLNSSHGYISYAVSGLKKKLHHQMIILVIPFDQFRTGADYTITLHSVLLHSQKDQEDSHPPSRPRRYTHLQHLPTSLS